MLAFVAVLMVVPRIHFLTHIVGAFIPIIAGIPIIWVAFITRVTTRAARAARALQSPLLGVLSILVGVFAFMLYNI